MSEFFRSDPVMNLVYLAVLVHWQTILAVVYGLGAFLTLGVLSRANWIRKEHHPTDRNLYRWAAGLLAATWPTWVPVLAASKLAAGTIDAALGLARLPARVWRHLRPNRFVWYTNGTTAPPYGWRASTDGFYGIPRHTFHPEKGTRTEWLENVRPRQAGEELKAEEVLARFDSVSDTWRRA